MRVRPQSRCTRPTPSLEAGTRGRNAGGLPTACSIPIAHAWTASAASGRPPSPSAPSVRGLHRLKQPPAARAGGGAPWRLDAAQRAPPTLTTCPARPCWGRASSGPPTCPQGLKRGGAAVADAAEAGLRRTGRQRGRTTRPSDRRPRQRRWRMMKMVKKTLSSTSRAELLPPRRRRTRGHCVQRAKRRAARTRPLLHALPPCLAASAARGHPERPSRRCRGV